MTAESGLFLPQYAASAVLDLERQLKMMRGDASMRVYASAVGDVVALLRAAVHVVLPPNGEVYRLNDADHQDVAPSDEELISFAGLPAPITAFQYPWTYAARGSNEFAAPKRITLAYDGKQIAPPGTLDDGRCFHCVLFSVVYNELHKAWTLLDSTLNVKTPLESGDYDGTWGLKGTATNLLDGYTLDARSVDAFPGAAELVFSNFKADVCAIIQCCHALRAGATLTETVDKSSTRRRKFARAGVGGFTYHVLTLPSGAEPRVDTGGSHAPPRFHVRRAHIRTLPSGKLTFVRQCLVGKPESGVVDKHYKVDASEAAQTIRRTTNDT